MQRNRLNSSTCISGAVENLFFAWKLQTYLKICQWKQMKQDCVIIWAVDNMIICTNTLGISFIKFTANWQHYRINKTQTFCNNCYNYSLIRTMKWSVLTLYCGIVVPGLKARRPIILLTIDNWSPSTVVKYLRAWAIASSLLLSLTNSINSWTLRLNSSVLWNKHKKGRNVWVKNSNNKNNATIWELFWFVQR